MDKQGFESGWVFIGPGAPRTLNADTDWVDFVEQPKTRAPDSELVTEPDDLDLTAGIVSQKPAPTVSPTTLQPRRAQLAASPTKQDLLALATPDIPRVLRRTAVILAFAPLILILSVPRFVSRIDWVKVVLALYIALLSCNFLYVPWTVSSQWKPNPRYEESPPIYHDGWLFLGPGKPDPMAANAYYAFNAYRSELPYARPDVLQIMLRTLAILVFAPLIVRPLQARITIAKALQSLARHIAPSDAHSHTEGSPPLRS